MTKKLNFKQTKIACYIGYVVQAIVVNLAPLFFVIFSDRYGIDNSGLGTLVLLNFVIQICTDVVSVRLTSVLSMRMCAMSAQILCCLGLTFMGLLPLVMQNTFLALAIATVVYSVGGGLIEVVISPVIDAIPIETDSETRGAKAAAMSLLHSFYCWGQMLVVLTSTLLLHFIGNDKWMFIPFIWAIVPLLNTLNFATAPFPKFVSENDRTPVGKIITTKLFVICAILIICSGASESAVSQWASMLAEKGLGVNKVAGDILGPCAFAMCMGIGRMFYGIMGNKIPLAKSLFACSVLCVASYIMISLFKSPIVSLLGCSVCGLAVSLMWPGVLSLASREFPKGGAALFSLLAICGDIGCSLGPWLTGFVSDRINLNVMAKLAPFSGLAADQISLKCGLLVSGIFPLVMIFACICFMRLKAKK